jgi:CTP:molybdopterin cytidylyltransferase MocA
MDGRRLRLAAVVLAAGAGSRFSEQPGAKLLAQVGGEPILARVLREVRAFGPETTIVVLGRGGDTIVEALDWHDELRVRNHDPDRGISSSLQMGIDALRVLPDEVDGAFIVLGDQPGLRADVMRDLRAAAERESLAERAVIVPRYDRPGARNPVLLLRAAWSWVDELAGDSGLGRLIESRPGSVLHVPAAGTMPDVDTPEDLSFLRDQGS